MEAWLSKMRAIILWFFDHNKLWSKNVAWGHWWVDTTTYLLIEFWTICEDSYATPIFLLCHWFVSENFVEKGLSKQQVEVAYSNSSRNCAKDNIRACHIVEYCQDWKRPASTTINAVDGRAPIMRISVDRWMLSSLIESNCWPTDSDPLA